MQITESTVRKLNISQLENLDPISVYLEDFGPGRGKITITCFDASWTNYWGAMGENYDIARFFSKASEDYLANKLTVGGIHQHVTDTDAIEADARRQVIQQRRDGELSQMDARELFDDIRFFVSPEENQDLLQRIYGDEWWGRLPQKPNPEYEYLCRIIRTIKAALQQETAISN